MARAKRPRGTSDLDRYRRFSVGEARSAHPYVAFLGLVPRETSGLLGALDDGLPFAAFERLHRTAGLSASELAEAVAISARTLVRRKREGRLTPAESDRLVRVARILARAVDVYDGDLERAVSWLASPIAALGGKRPLDLLPTEVGSREVESVLGRLEHGVFS